MATVVLTKPGVGFSEDYPEDLAGRLAWFVRKAGVPERAILWLILLDGRTFARFPAQGVDWKAVAKDHEERAWWMEGLLYDTLSLFKFDPEAMRSRIERREGPG